MSDARFKEGIQKALANPQLGGALGRFFEAYGPSRARAYEGLDFQALRTNIAQVKSHAAQHMEEMTAQFTAEAEKRGAKVFLAKSGEEVKAYIAKLAQEKGVRKIVKSKSMASEEIHLNTFLEEQGLIVKETDLGEWIIQLAGQRPSHMVMPAIHMSKEEVTDLFSKAVNERLEVDIPRLVKVARNELRKSFLEADLGITGANMAVAETGTLVLVTNEGNARLVTTLPTIHVAIVGLEKLVPKLADTVPILQALPRSATGQQLTSYVSMITGSVPTMVEGNDQPKELHIILLDNKRTEMRDDPVFKQALQCIRCASCLNVCPVYRMVGGHVFGHVYAGGIGTILTAWFNELHNSKDIQGLCIQCGRCKEVCPGNIDIPELIVELRRRITEKDGLSITQKLIFENMLSNRKVFHTMLRAASLAQKPFTAGGTMLRHLPLFFSKYSEFRSLPAIAQEPLRDRVAKGKQVISVLPGVDPGADPKKAVFYSGCLIDFAYPELGEDVQKVLNHVGYEVEFPQGQTCCGAPAKYNGVQDVVVKLAKQNVEALSSVEGAVVISACPTCTVALKHDFVQALKGDPEWGPKAEAVARKVRDFSQFVLEKYQENQQTLSGLLPSSSSAQTTKITYHDSCHLKRTLGISDEPRTLLTTIPGIQLVEMKESDMCCGMGGSYSLKFPELSAPILANKLKHINENGAQVVALDCPGCLMQISGGLDKQGSKVAVKHTAQILAEHLRD